MKIRITRACKGSPHPSFTRGYAKGEVLEVGSEQMPEELAEVFIAEGWAEAVAPPAPPPKTSPAKRRRRKITEPSATK